jgi:hypothetical protein
VLREILPVLLETLHVRRETLAVIRYIPRHPALPAARGLVAT